MTQFAQSNKSVRSEHGGKAQHVQFNMSLLSKAENAWLHALLLLVYMREREVFILQTTVTKKCRDCFASDTQDYLSSMSSPTSAACSRRKIDTSWAVLAPKEWTSASARSTAVTQVLTKTKQRPCISRHTTLMYLNSAMADQQGAMPSPRLQSHASKRCSGKAQIQSPLEKSEQRKGRHDAGHTRVPCSSEAPDNSLAAGRLSSLGLSNGLLCLLNQ